MGSISTFVSGLASLTTWKKKGSHLQKARGHARPRTRRKAPARPKPRGNPRRALADAREFPPLARLIHTLIEEKVRFQIVGMSAAILQGVPATTLDTDIWIDLPPRQYMKMLNVAVRLGGTVRANTVVDLADESTVNFVYRVDGLGSFDAEYAKAKKLWLAPRISRICHYWSRRWKLSGEAYKGSG
ncbi:MAG: hypothetical protein JWM16_5860 [Verrucomicrobiales bacterium]|nr:hypothetical protein [Verrucomicrobiales bacterium]